MTFRIDELREKGVDELALRVRKWRRSRPGKFSKRFVTLKETAPLLEMSEEALQRVEIGLAKPSPRFRELAAKLLERDGP